jgi:GTPase Era involved in 16S rRNA processing
VYTPLVVHNSEGKSYSINIIDTPGLFATGKRSNEEVLDSITDCIKGSITTISAVFIVVPFTSVLNQEDLQALNTVRFDTLSCCSFIRVCSRPH